MRLWHEDLLKRLPRQQLLGQHRECCALRGNGWGRKHKTVDYVFQYSPYKLFQYHELVMDEMKNRGYNVNIIWLDRNYRGEKCEAYENLKEVALTSPIYPEHDYDYKLECLENLEKKGVIIDKK